MYLINLPPGCWKPMTPTHWNPRPVIPVGFTGTGTGTGGDTWGLPVPFTTNDDRMATSQQHDMT